MREREIFIEALGVPPAEWAVVLEQACQGDAALLARVQRLLHEHARQESFILDKPPVGIEGTVDHRPSTGLPGAAIGPFKLLRQIGEGGMGVVWTAEQTEPVKRLVALKLIKAGMDSKAVLARFEAERQALAVMNHPNIANVLDAGTTPDGRPYFVMELVKGVPITEFCDARRLTLHQRLELFVQVCNAIQHSHQKGIIHRDIKPSNVLVALYDDKPVPKVIDFGIAKATGSPLTEHTIVTAFGAVVGTPEYMSPEQASLNQLDVDTRSDVYALGVLLYELLTGTTPMDRKNLGEAAWVEVLRIVREVEAPKPSIKVSTAEALPSIAAKRGTEPKRLQSLIRGELDWILLKSLEKDRARRYESASGFAADIQRYLVGDAVRAHPPSRVYRARKFLRRYRRPVFVGVIVLLALVAGMTGTTWGLIRAELALQRAVKAERKAEAEATIAAIERDKATAERDEKEKARSMEQEARTALQERVVRLHLRTAREAADKGESFTALQWYAAAWGADHATPARESVHRLRVGTALRQLPELLAVRFHSRTPDVVSFSPDALAVLSYTSVTREVQIWDPETGRLKVPPLKHPFPIMAAEWTPDGSFVWTRSADHALRLWDPATGKTVGRTVHAKNRGELTAAAVAPDGKTAVVSARGAGIIERVEFASGETVQTWSVPEYPLSLRFSPTGDRFACSLNTTALLWDLAQTEPLASLPHKSEGYRVGAEDYPNPTVDQMPLFSRNGRLLVTIIPGARGFAVWNALTGEKISEQKQVGLVYGATLSPSGRLLLCYGHGSTIGYCTVSETETGRCVATLKLTRNINNGCFFPDEKSVLLRAAGSGVERVEIASGRTIGPVLRACGKDRLSPQVSPDGEKILMAEFDGIARVWRLPAAEPYIEYDLANGGPLNGQLATRDGKIRFERADGSLGVVTGTAEPIALADAPFEGSSWLSPDGHFAVVADSVHGYRVWDSGTGRPLTDRFTSPGKLLWAGFTPDGEFLYTLSGGNEFECRETATWQPLPTRTIRQEPIPILAVCLSPDGRHLATAGQQNYATLFSTSNPDRPPRTLRHGGWVWGIGFSPDSRRVVTASGDLTARVWDLDSVRPAGPAVRVSRPLREATFSPDGELIMTLDDANIPQLWDWRTAEAVATLPRARDPLRGASWFSTDGRFIAFQPRSVTATPLGMRLDRIGHERADFSTYLELLSAERFTGSEEIVAVSLAESRDRTTAYRQVWHTLHPESAVADPLEPTESVAHFAHPPDALTPDQIRTREGETLTATLRIRAAGQSSDKSWYYLNTHDDYRDPSNFTVAISNVTNERLEQLGLPIDPRQVPHCKVTVRGKVGRYQGRSQIVLGDHDPLWIHDSQDDDP